MKKELLYSILGVVLGTIIIAGATYAYFSSATSSSSNAVSEQSYKFDVEYSGGQIIQGNLTPSVNKTGGYMTTVTIRMGAGSVLPTASLYVDILDISNNLLEDDSPWQKALKWEVEGTVNNEQVYTASGDFQKCGASRNSTCATNDKLYIVTDYQLSNTDTVFNVYIWLDAALVDSGVNGTHISGQISATTEQFTGEIN